MPARAWWEMSLARKMPRPRAAARMPLWLPRAMTQPSTTGLAPSLRPTPGPTLPRTEREREREGVRGSETS
jgi:hypothetical protein